MADRREIAGFEALVLRSAGGELEAGFVPGAGMVAASLRHRGEELLGQRKGVAAYAERHSTMGIPLLYPWANRLSDDRFEIAGRTVDLAAAGAALKRDGAGLPMHGLLAGNPDWRVERGAPDGSLAATFTWPASGPLHEAFPFSHTLRFGARVSAAALAIELTVEADGGVPVPISFGFHPYLRLPDCPREEWRISAPAARPIPLDGRGIPEADAPPRGPAEPPRGALGSRAFDHAYEAEAGEPFALEGGGRRIELTADPAYRFAQLYAPLDDDVVAWEPMTSPTNALVVGGPTLPVAEPGTSFTARFVITVSDV